MSRDMLLNGLRVLARLSIGLAAVFMFGWLFTTVPFVTVVLIVLVTWFGWELFDLFAWPRPVADDSGDQVVD